MKVLQIGKFFPLRGGVEKVIFALTEGLSERDVTCDMLCAKFRGVPFDEEDIPRSSLRGRLEVLTLNAHGRVLCVRAWARKAATMIAPYMIVWLRRHCNEYDIIHIHHPDPMACLALRLSGFRGEVVLHWHSDIVSQRFFLHLYGPLQRWLIRRSRCVVGTTPVYVENSPFLQGAKDKLECIPIGCHPVTCRREQAEEFRRRFAAPHLVFSLGRLVPYKGFEYLISAMEFLDGNYHLLLGGDGRLRAEMEKLIEEKGLQDRVTLAGYLENGTIPIAFTAADVFVMSSVMKSEAFGIVQIEAMSCGTPVVTTDVPGSGMSWVNAQGESGLVVPPRDPEALAAAIRGICEDSAAHERLSAGARERYERLFAFPVMIDKTIQLYEKIHSKN